MNIFIDSELILWIWRLETLKYTYISSNLIGEKKIGEKFRRFSQKLCDQPRSNWPGKNFVAGKIFAISKFLFILKIAR